MLHLGRKPERCFTGKIELDPRIYRYIYICDCDDYRLSKRRHNKLQKFPKMYSCSKCNGFLEFVEEITEF